MEVKISIAPKATDSWDWKRAPWNHIRGAIRRDLKGWGAKDRDSVDEAQRLVKIRDQYVNKFRARTGGVAPWWTKACSSSFKFKQSAFLHRFEDPKRYKRAKMCCRSVQKKAFKKFQKKLKVRLEDMSNSDRNFWVLA